MKILFIIAMYNKSVLLTVVINKRFFRQTKLTSFQRQLNLYGFSRLTRGRDSGGYYHELFLRGKTYLTRSMSRTKIKGKDKKDVTFLYPKTKL